MLKAARQAGARDVIAVVQPHRYTRLHSLFADFCACMNDAGTVIVADVYAAGEAPIAGVRATLWSRAARSRPSQRRPVAGAGAAGGDGACDRQARRLRRVPRCRDHAMGGRVAGELAALQGRGIAGSAA